MALPNIKNMVGMTVSGTPGTGTITLSAADTGYQSFATAYGANEVVDIRIKEGADWEMNRDCIYTHSGTTVTRGTFEASSTGAAVSFTSAAKVYVVNVASRVNAGNAALGSDQISGLALSWVSGSSISIGIGRAHVPSVDKVVIVSSAITLTSLALGNSVWGYVYLKSDGTAECATAAPSAIYEGSARTKTADTSRRFLGAVKTDSGGSIYEFLASAAGSAGLMAYKNINTGTSPFRAVSGVSYTATAVACDLSSIVPDLVSTDALLSVTMDSASSPKNLAVIGTLANNATTRLWALKLYSSASAAYPNTVLWSPINPASATALYWYNGANDGNITYIDCSAYRYLR